MAKVNMINYQRIALQTKFGKRNEKKLSKKFLIISSILAYIFFSLLFLNTDAQAFINHCCILDSLGITNIGEPLSWVKS